MSYAVTCVCVQQRGYAFALDVTQQTVRMYMILLTTFQTMYWWHLARTCIEGFVSGCKCKETALYAQLSARL